ncbi:MAG TPA: hemolysin III family protein [Caulobacteraceae bacterium]|jgi:hemolysin III|nr:hemolysin III family protein [Caulobacteraceae bacterium]
MTRPIPEEYLVGHYPNAVERAVDGWIHVVAIAVAGGGAAWLVAEALTKDRPGTVAAAALYGVALICMLAFSAVYNLSHPSPARPFLRRLDEAGIFLMIAGSYTPFTTQRLQGAWAVGMTALVWGIALAGIVGKLAFPRLPERAWTAVYLVFGWVAVLALGPLSRNLSLAVLALLLAGGLIYSAGSVFFHMRSLPFRRAVWHGFVCAGAGVHFWAVAAGVVLTPALSVAHTH